MQDKKDLNLFAGPGIAVREMTMAIGHGRAGRRSVVGIMNEFTRLAGHHRHRHPEMGVLDLAMQLAKALCSPLYGGNVSPDRELAAQARSIAT